MTTEFQTTEELVKWLSGSLNIASEWAYRKSGTQDPKVGSGTQDPQLKPYGGTLRWDPKVRPRVGPYGGTLR